MPGTFTKLVTVVTGDIITADLWNNEFDNIINNMTPTGIGDMSSNAAEMRSTTDPYPANTESLPVDLDGEIKRIRYQLLQLLKRFGPSNDAINWYAKFPYAFGTRGDDIASASQLVIPSNGNYFHVTGTTQIDSIASLGAGSRVALRFEASLTINQHNTNLRIPGGADFITQAGDTAEFVEYETGHWQLINYTSGSDVELNTTSLGLGDGTNDFSSITSHWSKQRIGLIGENLIHVKIRGSFVTHASSGAGSFLRIAGLNQTFNDTAPVYMLGGFVQAVRTVFTDNASHVSVPIPLIWDSPSIVSGNPQLRLFNGATWEASQQYVFTADFVLSI